MNIEKKLQRLTKRIANRVIDYIVGAVFGGLGVALIAASSLAPTVYAQGIKIEELLTLDESQDAELELFKQEFASINGKLDTLIRLVEK